MKLKPLHDWAVIIPAEAAVRTAGGIYIPDSAKEKPEEGVVEAIGPGAYDQEKPGKKKDAKERKFIPTTVKPGDRVLFERWSGKTHTIGTEERILVRERDILGLIERPLQIPETTSSGTPTGIVPREAAQPPQAATKKLLKTAVAPEGGKRAAPKKAAQKKAAKKKAAKKKGAAKAGKKKAVKTLKKGGVRTGASKAGKGKKAAKKKR